MIPKGQHIKASANPENRQSPDHDHRRYFILLVGINEYPEPISPLRGCIQDVVRIENFLQKWAEHRSGKKRPSPIQDPGFPVESKGPLHILKLLDSTATYHNIYKAFTHFLCQARTSIQADGTHIQDIVWFHFSGHGSEEFTAEEFLPLEPNGKDQTLVCYQASHADEPLHLADKELAVLLHQVATVDEQGLPKEKPHIIVSLDCCHSGSGTRDFLMDTEIRPRRVELLGGLTREEAKHKGKIRDLNSYAGGYYTHLLTQQPFLELPLGPHVLLSGCESVQLAGDLTSGGVFSSGLLAALEASHGEINYADLYSRSRSFVQKIRKHEQTPKFETLGDFNPFTRFLDGSPLGIPKRYPVKKENGTWFVQAGALHGLPMESEKPIRVEIQTLAPESKVLGIVSLKGIGAQKSSFQMDLDPGEYQAIMNFLPVPPTLVWLHGEASGIASLKEAWIEGKGIKAMEDLREEGEAQLEVEVRSDAYIVRDRKHKRLVLDWPREVEAEALVFESLEKMANWDRSIRLNHAKSGIKEWTDFHIEVLGAQYFTLTHPDTQIEASPQHLIPRGGNLVAGFNPKWIVKGAKQDLYAYLFHLRNDYSIKAYEGEVVYRPKEHSGKSIVEFPMWKQLKGWGIAPEEAESTSYFKLFVSTEPFDYPQLEQSRVGGDRGKPRKNINPYLQRDDWCCFTYKVSLIRP